MDLALLLQIVQILSGAGAAAVDLTKIVNAVKARGDTKLTDAETAAVKARVSTHVNGMSGVDFLQGAASAHRTRQERVYESYCNAGGDLPSG